MQARKDKKKRRAQQRAEAAREAPFVSPPVTTLPAEPGGGSGDAPGRRPPARDAEALGRGRGRRRVRDPDRSPGAQRHPDGLGPEPQHAGRGRVEEPGGAGHDHGPRGRGPG